jgi:hypothetical protein
MEHLRAVWMRKASNAAIHELLVGDAAGIAAAALANQLDGTIECREVMEFA